MQALPTVSYQAPASTKRRDLTSQPNKENNDELGNNPADYPRAAAGRRASDVALQFLLGLFPDRWPGPVAADRDNPARARKTVALARLASACARQSMRRVGLGPPHLSSVFQADLWAKAH